MRTIFKFLLLLLLGGVLAFPGNTEVKEDDANENDKRIIGGKLAPLGKFPFLVMLTYRAKISGLIQTEKSCGGAIINERWVLTAGHCINSLYSNMWGEKMNQSVAAGTINLWDDWNEYRQDIPIKETYVHPEYNAGKQPHDLGTIKLLYAFTWNPFVQPIELVKEDHVPGSLAIAAGWGAVSKEQISNQARDLYYLDPQPLVNLEECKKQYVYYEGSQSLVTDYHICLASVDGKAPCYGDSGSPLIEMVDGRPLLIGVVSFGKDLHTCGEYPTVYAKVEQWVRDTIQNSPY